MTEIHEVKGKKESFLTREIGSGKPKAKTLSLICSQFSILIQSGLPIHRVVEIIAEQTKEKRMKKALRKVASDVAGGYSLAASFENQNIGFPMTLIETVRAGEESGSLERSFAKLALFFEKSYKIRAKVVGAMLYPIFVILVAAVVLIVMMAKVIPTFVSMFADMEMELPLSTRILISSCEFFSRWWLWLLLGIALIVVAFLLYRKKDTGRQKLAFLSLKLPLLGRIANMNGAGEFATTMSTLLASGISMSNALRVTAKVMSNAYFSRCTEHMVLRVENGWRLGQSVAEEGCFPPLLAEMIAIGEETGALEETLAQIADYFDAEVETIANRAISLLEPALLVFLAIFAGFIVVSLYLPMFTMYSGM